jgi:hypothetical protein
MKEEITFLPDVVWLTTNINGAPKMKTVPHFQGK